MTEKSRILNFEHITDLVRGQGLATPAHPLVALVDYDRTPVDLSDAGAWYQLSFYKISFKTSFNGSVRYGQGSYDFKDGGMAFLEPGQLVEKSADPADYQGFALYVHPDLFKAHPLAREIRSFGFFSYDVSEALFLSAPEKQTVGVLFEAIRTELAQDADQFSRDVLIAQLQLLLNHSNRFYHRQFTTRAADHHALIGRMQDWLRSRFEGDEPGQGALPSPQELARHLNVSQRYLSDMLKALTGRTTQQHLHEALIDSAKRLLTQTKMNTAEIAYQLGFEHPQSFNKLFKARTGQSPLRFRDDHWPIPAT